MNKKYLPSLVIFAKGMMILALGILFKFRNMEGTKSLLIIGGLLIFASVVVLIIMSLIKPKQ